MRAFFVEGERVGETRDVAEVVKLRAEGRMMWIDLGEKTEPVDAMLARDFEMHPLVIEDIWCDRAVPKIEDFDDYLYVLVHGVKSSGVGKPLELVEVDIVVGPSWVITHHHGAACVEAVMRSLSRSPRCLKKGPAWVLHEVLDHLVDDYLPILDGFDTELGQLEESVIELAGTPKGHRVLSRLLALKRTLQNLHRVSVHQREILLRLSRGEFDEIPEKAMPFFRDVYDHFAHMIDLGESYRESATSAIESYLSMQSNRMNEVMKTLTMISTVMLPLTFIAGVYGMNFEHMPELKWPFGYAYALGMMALIAAGIAWWFRHKRWF